MDHGKTARCCQRAKPDEIAEDPSRYDCTRCELKRQVDGLWRVNAEAWRIYQAVGGRAVSACEWRGGLLDRLTADWAAEDVLDLLKRLDTILDITDPKETPRGTRVQD